MKLKLFVILSISATAFFASCKKESGSTTLRVKLTDAPAVYDEVNVDIREVNIRMEDDSASWVSLPTAAGIYNLLEYQNGLDTLISEAIVNGTAIQDVRLVLGTENTITTNGETHELTIPSGSESGLKIKLHKKLDGGVEELTLDFDAGLSVTQEIDGFKLRPVITVLH
jgi:hypothetical protein